MWEARDPMSERAWPKAFLVDLDNTLHDYKRVAQMARSALANRIEGQHGVPREQVLARYEQLIGEEKDVVADSGRELRFARMRRLLATWPQTCTLAPAPFVQLLEDALLSAVRPFEGALASFNELRAGAPTIVVTEGYGDIQKAIVSRLGLRLHKRELLASYEHGVRKLDGSAYRLAGDWLALPPDDIVMVGDNWTWDILAAAQAGMWQVWVRAEEPLRVPWPARHMGSVPCFRDVPALVAKWCANGGQES
jgi:FMN phosphatase YigB (HAD superfamily)